MPTGTQGTQRPLALASQRGLGDPPMTTSARPVKNAQVTQLKAMIAAWSGQSVSGDGDEPLVLDPLPVQTPHPPLWVAAFGPKASVDASTSPTSTVLEPKMAIGIRPRLVTLTGLTSLPGRMSILRLRAYPITCYSRHRPDA